MSVRASPEVELLLACARGAESASDQQLGDLLKLELDWARAERLALRHRQIPSMYLRLSVAGRDATPPAVLARLRRRFYAIAEHNRQLERELLRLLSLLAAGEVAAVPFKGPVLAAAVYRNPALRMSSDLDILVGRGEIGRAAELLAGQGYRETRKHGALFEAGARPFRHARELASADGRRTVDLHWKLSQSYFAFGLGLAQLGGRLGTTTVAGTQIATLSAEDALIFLCVHGARHSWTCLAWICDIGELLHTQTRLRWAEVLRLADALHCRRMLLLGLRLARDLLGAPLPPEIARAVAADQPAGELAALATAWLFGEDAPSELEQARFYLRARERWWDRLQYTPELARILLVGA